MRCVTSVTLKKIIVLLSWSLSSVNFLLTNFSSEWIQHGVHFVWVAQQGLIVYTSDKLFKRCTYSLFLYSGLQTFRHSCRVQVWVEAAVSLHVAESERVLTNTGVCVISSVWWWGRKIWGKSENMFLFTLQDFLPFLLHITEQGMPGTDPGAHRVRGHTQAPVCDHLLPSASPQKSNICIPACSHTHIHTHRDFIASTSTTAPPSVWGQRRSEDYGNLRPTELCMCVCAPVCLCVSVCVCLCF